MSRSFAPPPRTSLPQGGRRKETSRSVALRILHRVGTEGAYANYALAAALQRHPLERRERALVEELVYGVLRRRNTLDWLLEACCRRPYASLDPWVKNILRLSAYQIRYLEGVPDYAAVNDAVDLCRLVGRKWAAGFVNAVLRAMQRLREEPALPSLDEDAATHLSVRASHPRWIVRRWIEQWGVEETAKLCDANNLASPLAIRVNCLRSTVADVVATLVADGCSTTPAALHPDALRLSAAADVRTLASFRDGDFFIQDESSMAAVQLLGLGETGLASGQRVLDACAGRGGKAASIAMELRGAGSITCWDVHAAKLRQLTEECGRLGVANVRVQVADALRPPLRQPLFDAALVDAPCSGLGVVRRYADLRWRRGEEDLERLRTLQVELLASVADVVVRGGTLVYAVCSTEPEETTQVVERILRAGGVRLIDPRQRLETLRRADLVRDDCLLTLPHRHGVDGFFAAAFEITR